MIPPAATSALRPRTLHVTNAYHATSGGIRTFYHALLTEASRQEREMTLVVPAETSSIEPRDRWTAIQRIAAPPAPWFDRRYRLLRPRHYVGRRAPLARLLATFRPDVVEVCDKYTLMPLAAMLRAGRFGRGPRPTVVGLSCERMDDNVAAYLPAGRRLRHVAQAYLRYAYGPAFDRHVANSDYTAEELRRGAGIDDVVVALPGVDAERLLGATRDGEWRASLLRHGGGNAHSILALYAGRLSPEKQLDRLIHAVGVLAAAPAAPDVRLVIAGDGPQQHALAALADAVAPGRVQFLGNVADRLRLATLYASADVFVHPNPHEPFGIGPLEAMAAGVPVVVSVIGGVRSYANDDNAWLTEDDPVALAAALVAAAAGRGDPRVGRAAATARGFAWPEMARRHFAVLDRLHAERLSSRRAGSRAVSWARGAPAARRQP